MNLFSQRKNWLMALEKTQRRPGTTGGRSSGSRSAPDELFMQCPACREGTPRAALAKALYVCPRCGYHFKISAYYRLSLVLDSRSFHELDARLVALDPIRFPGYTDKLHATQDATGLTEGVVTATGRLAGVRVVAAALDSRFLMGSMGVAVGEKLTRAIELATKKRLPLIIFSVSGGARMQEGIFSLMQMAKTAAALARHDAAGLLYISVLTNPTMGGVTASFASLGDVTVAEPGARIGFAGPRVIEQTIGEKLPDGFQSAEYLLEHGFLDAIVPRAELKETLARVLKLHGGRTTA